MFDFYKVLGVSDEDIATDYGLTKVGIAPAAALIAGRMQAMPDFQGSQQGTLNVAINSK
jgi:hypothetical protein